MTAEFRRATPDDAAQIAEVIHEVVAEPNPVGLDPMTPDEVIKWIDRQGSYGAMFVAVEEGAVLGFSAIDFDSSRAEECTIGAWIRGSARRRGLASILFEEALGFAGEQGYKRVRGRLPESNEAALSFLSTIGALVPIINPGAHYDMPIYEVRRDE